MAKDLAAIGFRGLLQAIENKRLAEMPLPHFAPRLGHQIPFGPEIQDL
jgi:hypothetical protein